MMDSIVAPPPLFSPRHILDKSRQIKHPNENEEGEGLIKKNNKIWRCEARLKVRLDDGTFVVSM